MSYFECWARSCCSHISRQGSTLKPAAVKVKTKNIKKKLAWWLSEQPASLLEQFSGQKRSVKSTQESIKTPESTTQIMPAAIFLQSF